VSPIGAPPTLATPLIRAPGTHGAIVFVHGLGSSGRSWQGVVDELPTGVGYLAPDLPGHGGSTRLARYSFGAMAAALSDTIAAFTDAPVTMVSHSLGGVPALLVASGLFGVKVDRLVFIGTKQRWTAAEVERAISVAAKPVKLFPARREALDFWGRVAGAPADFDVTEELAADVVAEVAGGWALAYDTRVSALGGAPIPQLVALSRAPVTVVRGEHDPIVSAEDAANLGLDVVTISGAGHSPQLDQPAEIARLSCRIASSFNPAESVS
jgi:pimeloyl-ACP methyl ester carboxylesterase